MTMSPAWPTVEDYLLDLDAVTLPGNHDSAPMATPTAKAQPKQIRLRIFRRYGPTAVAPGLKRLSVAVGPSSDSSSRPPLEDLGEGDVSTSTQQTPSSATSSGLQSDVMQDCFYGLPFDASQVTSGEQGRSFSKPARNNSCVLAVPAPDVVAGLIVLSWAEFGSNSGEGGLWMFSGMAIRMAQDLGLHRSDETDPDPQAAFMITPHLSTLHQQKSRLVMFWSVFTLDVCVLLIMGRPPTIRRAEIEVPLPTSDDMKPVHLDFDGSHKMCHTIFPAVARSMYIFSEAVELFNLNKAAESSCPLEEIDKLEKELAQCAKQLDASLFFSADTYRKSSSDGHAGIFLMLHLYFYTFVALLSTRRCQSLPAHERSKRSAQVACHKIVQTLAIAEAIDNKGYTATPFLAYSIFIAAFILLEDILSDTEGTGGFIAVVDLADVDILSQKLHEMSRFFHGVNATIDAHPPEEKRSGTQK
ncbi:Zn(2)-C6 fungal-type domain-containing protein [Fusarium sp. LHS14.1]|nr:Zn(2)-C6 fungal-type domain-containing protein [Fusarium sp. LHS14.1]